MENLMLLNYGQTVLSVMNNVIKPDPVKQVMDPMSSIVRLALLIFKETGTKISISNNRIYYQPPTILQGPMRWSYGDKRNDLHNLCSPIEKAILWYEQDDNHDIGNIFQFAVKGLDKLKESYIQKDPKIGESNLVCHSIAHYISLINRKLENRKVEKATELETSSLKYLWNKTEISIINGLITLAIEKRDKEEDYKYLINAVEAILEGKDKSLKKIIDRIYANI